MTDPKAASSTQIANIEASTGRAVPEWAAVVKETGLAKHGQILAYFKSEHGLTYGNANALALRVREILEGTPTGDDDLLTAQYAGAKAALKPIYDELALAVQGFGPVEFAVKKTGVSLRRSKQFALIEAKSATRIQLGLNFKGAGIPASGDRLKLAGGMCTHLVNVTDVDQIDDELIGWLRQAYLGA